MGEKRSIYLSNREQEFLMASERELQDRTNITPKQVGM